MPKPSTPHKIQLSQSNRSRVSGWLLRWLIVTALLLSLLPIPAAQAAPWTPQGPAPELFGQQDLAYVNADNEPVNGNVVSIAASPTDANLVYVGMANGGVWKSTNAGVANPTWTPLTDNLKSQSIGAVALDLSDATGQTLVVGTGRFSGYASRGDDLAGLYYSTNGGASWTVTTDSQLSAASINSVAARNNTLLAASANGLFRSTTGPLGTWSKISGTGGLPNAPAVGLTADPVNLSRFYATFNGAGGGIFRTDDVGATWTNVTANINVSGNAPSCITVAVSPTGAIYAALNGLSNGLYRSADSGATWTALDAPPGSYVCTNAASTIGLSADKTNANLVYIASYAMPIYRVDAAQPSGAQAAVMSMNSSTTLVAGMNSSQTSALVGSVAYFPTATPFVITIDNEQLNVTAVTPTSWYFTLTVVRGFNGTTAAAHSNGATVPFPASYGNPHPDHAALAYDANGALLNGNHGGLFRLANPASPASASNFWVSANGTLMASEIHDIAYDSVSNVLVGGFQDNGAAYQTAQNSQSWTKQLAGGDGGDVAVDNVTQAASGQSLRYASAQTLSSFKRYVFSAANTQVSVVALNTAPIIDKQFTTPVVLNTIDPKRMLVGGSGNVWESLDMGTTFASAFPAGATPVGVNANDSQAPIAYGGYENGVAKPDIFYVGSGSQIYKRAAAGGAVLPTASLPAGRSAIRDIVLDPTNWQQVYAIDNDQLFRSLDGGATWTDVTGGLLNGLSSGELTVLELVAGASPYLAVGTRSGVFASQLANLGSWVKLETGLPDVLVYDLDYDATDDVLAIATLGRGGWLLPNAAAAFVPSSVAPVLALTTAPTTANEGTTEYLYKFTVSDPGDRFTTSGPTITGGNLVAGSLKTTASGGEFKVTFPDGPAAASISLQVTDSTGLASNTATANVTVANVIPSSVTINGAPASPVAGTLINLTNTVVDPSPTDQAAGFTYLWFVYKPAGAAAIANGSGAAYSFTPSIAGTYTVYLNATDKNGGLRQGSKVITVGAAVVAAALTEPQAQAAPNVVASGQLLAADQAATSAPFAVAAAGLTADAAAVTVFEGQPAENFGTFVNANGNPVTLSASVGTLAVIPAPGHDTLTLNTGENGLRAAVIDSAAGFAYFGTQTSPAQIIKVRLSDFTEVGAITLNTGENNLRSAVIDPSAGFAYFGAFTAPGIVVKIDLATFTRVGAMTFNTGENNLGTGVIDPAAGFAYFATFTNLPDTIVKIDLATFTRVGSLTLSNASRLSAAVIDPAAGFAYFGTNNVSRIVDKVDLATFTHVGTLTLNTGETILSSAVIDPAAGFAYFGTGTSPGIVVKVNLATFTRDSALTLNAGENVLSSAVINPAAGFAYFGTATSPGRIVKVNLATFTRQAAEVLNAGENALRSGVIDTISGHAYFGTEDSPGKVIRIRATQVSGNWSWSYIPDDGPAQSQEVTITATDDVNSEVTNLPFSLAVENASPSATFANGGPVNEGSTGTVSFSDQSDPSTADTTAGLRYAYDFDNDGIFEVGGDGTYANAVTNAAETVPASYLAEGPGTRTVLGRISDKDGGYIDYTTDITINNAAPAAAVSGPATALAGQVVNFVLSAADGSPADQQAGFTYSINWGDGSPAQAVGPVAGTGDATAKHAYATTGNYTIQVTATDKDGAASAPASAAITVNALNSSSLQALIGTAPQVSLQPASDAALQSAVAAVNGLSAPASPVVLTIVLGNGPYSGVTLSPPANIVLDLAGNDTSDITGTQINGASPAVTVNSGEVFVQGASLTTATDSPTILVTGGHLTLGQNWIDESTSANNVAIKVTGGVVDYGFDVVTNINGDGGYFDIPNRNVLRFPEGIDDFLVPNLFARDGSVLTSVQPSALSLTAAPSPSTNGQAVTLVATVSVNFALYGRATGSVSFYDGATLLDTVAVQTSGGTTSASLTTSSLSVGTHALTAVYNGDSTYVASSAELSHVVNSGPANQAPVAQNQSVSTSSGTPLAITLVAQDPENNPLTYSLVTQPTQGTLAGTAPNVTYTPASGYTGSDSFTFKANDGTADSNVATVSITVNAGNRAPVATNDSYSTLVNTALTVPAPGVLNNDSDADANALTAVKVTNPAHGTVTLNANGSFTYTPAKNYTGADSFTYQANDGSLNSNVATVSLTVNGKVTAQIQQVSFRATSSTTTPDPTYPAQSPRGVVVLSLVARNTGVPLRNVSFRVVKLTQNNYLLNADGTPGQVGSKLSVPSSALPGGNQIWDRNEQLTQNFRVGLMANKSFVIQLDVYAAKITARSTDPESPIDPEETEELVDTFTLEIDPTAPVEGNTIYLPVVSKQ